MNRILEYDLDYTFHNLSNEEQEKLYGATILITGCGGFLGQYYLAFFHKYGKVLNLKKVIGIDTFLLGKSVLVQDLQLDSLFDIRTMDIKCFQESNLASQYAIDYVFHMASIASPTYYRLHPLETVDSNIWGLRALLDSFTGYPLKGFLFYSSSEVYGDPDERCVPTSENYWGNVSCIGPRACYDESKRFGETLCWIYHKLHNIPIRIVRLFNVYGPGLKMNDRRVPADFANAIINNENIVIYSNGQPKRTFCYVADSVVGEIKALLSSDFDVYNIGANTEESSILQLAEVFKTVGIANFDYTGSIIYKKSEDADYLTHDPQRRCPNLTKAKDQLDYLPTVKLDEGVYRYLAYLKEEGEQAVW